MEKIMLVKINSKILTFLLLTLFFSSIVSCSDNDEDIYGTCEIIGNVTDHEGNAVTGADIKVLLVEEGGMPTCDITDTDGNFRIFIDKSTSELLLEVSSAGYENYYCHIIPEFKNSSYGVTLGTAHMVIDKIILTKMPD